MNNIEEFESFMADRFGDSIDRRRCLNGDGNDYMAWDMQVAKIVWMHVLAQLEAAQKERDEFRKRLKLERSILDDADKELSNLRTKLANPVVLPDIIRDANRYRFLRDEDSWGEDSNSWDVETRTGLISSENLMELRLDHFDAAIDARMAASDIPFINPVTSVLSTEDSEWKQRAGAAEARLLVPDELLKIGERIRTQDNRCTDQPLFAVMQQMEIVVDEDYDHDRVAWIFDGVEVNKTKSRRLEALHQGLRDTRGYDRVAVKEIDEFVTACFTRQGCENHINCNGHNLRKPFIHVFGSFRNNEYQLVRDWLSSLGNPVEGGE